MPASTSRSHAPIAVLTDFGYRDHYAGVMKGVIASIAAAAPVIDVTHGIPAQQVVAGAIALRQCFGYFPARTVFLAVVDPGVGTERLPIAIETRTGGKLVGPDNGLLSPAAEEAGIKKIIELRSPRYRLPAVSTSFHGRDIFAPAAAWLWRGVAIDSLGPRLQTIVRLETVAVVVASERELKGHVIYIDGFGNLITNIGRAEFDTFYQRLKGYRLTITLGRSTRLKLYQAYADAPEGAGLALFGSFGLLEVAVRDGNAAEKYAAGAGTTVLVRAERMVSA